MHRRVIHVGTVRRVVVCFRVVVNVVLGVTFLLVISGRWLGHLGLFVWVGGMVSGLCLLGISTYSIRDDACSPDGEFTLWPGDFNYWHSSNFFQINFGFGKLTFAQAKAVDVVWDVVSVVFETYKPSLAEMIRSLVAVDRRFWLSYRGRSLPDI